MNTASNYTEALGFALEEKYELRDVNCVTPDAVLLFDETTGELEEVEIRELPSRFPLEQPGMRWAYSDLGQLVAAKATLYLESILATGLAKRFPSVTLSRGTVCVVDPVRPGPLYWCRITVPIAATASPE